jgi:CheY-like chemotaxis protein
VINKGARVAAKLLIADDSTTIQKVFERTFPPEEFTLSFANNGEEALTKARTDKPNAIIADINMPAKNGFELCEELKRDPVLRGTPVLLLIGILDDFDEDEGRRVGADGFIIKPFESNAAISKVREALAKGGSALPKGEPAAGGAEEIVDLTNIAQAPTATPPPQKKGAEDILNLADVLEETTATPAPPSQKDAEDILELSDLTAEPTAAPPPQKKGAEDILDVAEVLGETPATPATPSDEKIEDILELSDLTAKPSAIPPPAPPQEKKEDEGFVLQTSLRDFEEELKAEFPGEGTEVEQGLDLESKTELPKEEAEIKEELSAPVIEEDFGSLELDLPFDDSETEPQAKDTDWTSLFGNLELKESGEESPHERIGTILDESTSELEKIEGLGAPTKDTSGEDMFTKKFREPFFGEGEGTLESEKPEGPDTLKEEPNVEDFAEQFMDDFEPVFEPSEDFLDISTRERDMEMPAREGTDDLTEKVASRVGHELQEVVEKVIKEKIPKLVREEIDRLKKE